MNSRVPAEGKEFLECLRNCRFLNNTGINGGIYQTADCTRRLASLFSIELQLEHTQLLLATDIWFPEINL